MLATFLSPEKTIRRKASYREGSQALKRSWFLEDKSKKSTNRPSVLCVSSSTKYQTIPRERGETPAGSLGEQRALRRPNLPKSPRSPTYRFCTVNGVGLNRIFRVSTNDTIARSTSYCRRHQGSHGPKAQERSTRVNRRLHSYYSQARDHYPEKDKQHGDRPYRELTELRKFTKVPQFLIGSTVQPVRVMVRQGAPYGSEPRPAVFWLFGQVHVIAGQGGGPDEVNGEEPFIQQQLHIAFRQVVDGAEQLANPTGINLGAARPQESLINFLDPQAPPGYEKPRKS